MVTSRLAGDLQRTRETLGVLTDSEQLEAESVAVRADTQAEVSRATQREAGAQRERMHAHELAAESALVAAPAARKQARRRARMRVGSGARAGCPERGRGSPGAWLRASVPIRRPLVNRASRRDRRWHAPREAGEEHDGGLEQARPQSLRAGRSRGALNGRAREADGGSRSPQSVAVSRPSSERRQQSVASSSPRSFVCDSAPDGQILRAERCAVYKTSGSSGRVALGARPGSDMSRREPGGV